MSDSDSPFLAARFPGQRRLLALDGGGIRGLITLGILEKLEADLATASGRSSFRLSDYFDFIGGTSTGAILAAGLCCGLSVAELIQFYRESGKLMFQKELLLRRFWGKFKSDPLKEKLQEVLGSETTLGSDRLKTLLLIVMRNVTTDSPWPVTNNPRAKYNAIERQDCNLRLPLWKLVRASTAAPTFFPPEIAEIGSHEFVFVDGGVTPYNVPAFLMYRIAVAPAYKLEWQTGEEAMLIVSVGTGSVPRLGPDSLHAQRSVIEIGVAIAGEMMNGMAYDQDINCRVVGRCVFGPRLDGEVGTLMPEAGDTVVPRQFRYARYDPEITRDGLAKLGLAHIDPLRVAKLDSIEAMDELIQIGRVYAKENLLTKSHLGPFVRFTES